MDLDDLIGGIIGGVIAFFGIKVVQKVIKTNSAPSKRKKGKASKKKEQKLEMVKPAEVFGDKSQPSEKTDAPV